MCLLMVLFLNLSIGARGYGNGATAPSWKYRRLDRPRGAGF